MGIFRCLLGSDRTETEPALAETRPILTPASFRPGLPSRQGEQSLDSAAALHRVTQDGDVVEFRHS